MISLCRKVALILVLCIGGFTNAHAITGGTQGTIFFPPENPQDCNANTYLNWSGPGSNVRCEPLPTITALECPEGYAGTKLYGDSDLKLCVFVAKQPKSCPQFMPPLCDDDEELVGGGVGSDGCNLAPQCKKKVVVTSCPIFMPPLCEEGEVLVGGGKGADGCDLAPVCAKKTFGRGLGKI